MKEPEVQKLDTLENAIRTSISTTLPALPANTVSALIKHLTGPKFGVTQVSELSLLEASHISHLVTIIQAQKLVKAWAELAGDSCVLHVGLAFPKKE